MERFQTAHQDIAQNKTAEREEVEKDDRSYEEKRKFCFIFIAGTNYQTRQLNKVYLTSNKIFKALENRHFSEEDHFCFFYLQRCSFKTTKPWFDFLPTVKEV